MFLMSDTVSLLLRLQMEGKPTGVDLKDRWRELSNMMETKFVPAVGDNFFYDFHVLVALLFGGEDKTDLVDSAVEAMRSAQKGVVGKIALTAIRSAAGLVEE